MLAEMFMLRLETAFRKVDAQQCSIGDRRFVPIKLPISCSDQPAALVDQETDVGQQEIGL
jgi:hypothetical protein